MNVKITHNVKKPEIQDDRDVWSIYPWRDMKPGSEMRVGKRKHHMSLHHAVTNLRSAARARMKRCPGEVYIVYEDEANQQAVAYREK